MSLNSITINKMIFQWLKRIQVDLKRSVVFCCPFNHLPLMTESCFPFGKPWHSSLFSAPMVWGSWYHPQGLSVKANPGLNTSISQTSEYSDCIRIVTWSKLLEGEWTTGIFWILGEKRALFPMGLLSCYNVNLGKWETSYHHIERTCPRMKPTP